MKILIPLTECYAGDIPCPRPEVTLRVRTKYGDFVPVRLVVDTAADLTTIPIPLADRLGIPVSWENPGTALGLVGSTAKYRGTVHVRVANLDYDWPCDFIRPPSPSAAPGGGTQLLLAERPSVLGRSGLLDAFATCLDGEYLVLTRLGPLRRWWRRFWRRVSRRFSRVRTANQPL
jgi:hypothetical protein